MTPQSYNSYQYSYNLGQPPGQSRHVYFSQKELKHISVAALLVVGIGFSIGLYSNYFPFFGAFPFLWSFGMMAVFAVIMTASFLTHEIAHKVMGQKRGLWAEFRLTTWGAVITFLSIFLPIRLISPGAMMLSGSPNGDEIVKISIAGPATNLVFSLGLLGAAIALNSVVLSAGGYIFVLIFAAYINAFMAVFNLIPFGILDGYKIFSFNKKLWAMAFVPAVVLALVTYLLM